MKILLRDHATTDWRTIESSEYNAETELQRLLAESPKIISMEEIRPGTGPLVAAVREFTLPVGSIDLLAFTAAGDIAIIECKLSGNAQVKREVIGQILDYAAHLWEMSYEELDGKINARLQTSLADLVRKVVEPSEWDEEAFRSSVRSNLIGGNFVLLIAVNEINEELSRIVRFVNSSGDPGYAFAALEMRRFKHAETEMLVPRVFGPVRAVTTGPGPEPRRIWDQESFFAELRARHGESDVEVATRILEWAKEKVTRISWGAGQQTGSFVPFLHHNEREYPLFAVYTYGSVEIYFQWYQYKAPFESEEKRIVLLNKFNEIQGINLSAEAVYKRPNVKLATLAAPGAIEQFLKIYDWMLEQITFSEGVSSDGTS